VQPGPFVMRLQTLKKRAEFLRLRGGNRATCDCFALETRPRLAVPQDAMGPRFGFTVTKALGNAVVRNRIRRRLKAAVLAINDDQAKANHDYRLCNACITLGQDLRPGRKKSSWHPATCRDGAAPS
jgi:ribonuclease P protein component